MTVFDDLASAMGDLVGSTEAGGWALGAIVLVALMLPLGLMMFARGAGAGGSLFILLISAFVVVFNVGVGWWEDWALVFIAIIILFGWWMGKGSGEGGI